MDHCATGRRQTGRFPFKGRFRPDLWLAFFALTGCQKGCTKSPIPDPYGSETPTSVGSSPAAAGQPEWNNAMPNWKESQALGAEKLGPSQSAGLTKIFGQSEPVVPILALSPKDGFEISGGTTLHTGYSLDQRKGHERYPSR